jgi:hypothetical protein
MNTRKRYVGVRAVRIPKVQFKEKLKGAMMMETKIRQLRKARGETIFGVGRIVGLRDFPLSLFERRRMAVFPKYRKALADYYGMEESELFDEDDFAKVAE